MITQILIPVIAMAALGLIFGVGLAYALKLFGIQVDPTTFLLLSKLPGANCGVCGKAGCAGFAEALQKGETLPSGCVVATEEERKEISEILGIDYSAAIKKVAVVFCCGGKNAKDKYVYRGIKSCKAATLFLGGYKSCSFGCLSFGDCMKACPFDAITMVDGLPKIDPKKCTACGECVKACPRNIISLEQFDKGELTFVACSSTDKASVVKNICSTGCIACGICQKLSDGVFEVKDNLAKVDYKKATEKTDWNTIIEKCPMHTIQKMKR